MNEQRGDITQCLILTTLEGIKGQSRRALDQGLGFHESFQKVYVPTH